MRSRSHRSAWGRRWRSRRVTGTTATPIQHVVVIFQENVSFDHYFGTYPFAMNTGAPGEPNFQADPRTPSVNNLLSAGLLNKNPNFVSPNGNPFRLTRAQAATCDQDHDYTDEQAMFDLGLMDNFLRVQHEFMHWPDVGAAGAECWPSQRSDHGILRRQHRHRVVELRAEFRDERQLVRHRIRAVDARA